MKNENKIILDLCGGTGSWSKPYKEAGYDVKLITLPKYDVRNIFIANRNYSDEIIFKYYPETYRCGITKVKKKDVYGILAAPPCTMFSFARTKAKKRRNLLEGMECVRACLDIIWFCMEIKQDTAKKKLPLKFWALENPNGMLKYFLGKPVLEFSPWEFGDKYQKKTHLWGWFNEPKKSIFKKGDIKKFGGDKDIKFRFDKVAKSITPAGFAKAFFEANK